MKDSFYKKSDFNFLLKDSEIKLADTDLDELNKLKRISNVDMDFQEA